MKSRATIISTQEDGPQAGIKIQMDEVIAVRVIPVFVEGACRKDCAVAFGPRGDLHLGPVLVAAEQKVARLRKVLLDFRTAGDILAQPVERVMKDPEPDISVLEGRLADGLVVLGLPE